MVNPFLMECYGMPLLIPDSHLKVKGKNRVMKKIRKMHAEKLFNI